jgi:hypothetical protein
LDQAGRQAGSLALGGVDDRPADAADMVEESRAGDAAVRDAYRAGPGVRSRRITTGSSCAPGTASRAHDRRGLPVGHFLPEKAPGLVTTALRGFFGRVPGDTPVGDTFSRLWF